MRILVTGGLGSVGSVLVRELRSRGHTVYVSDLLNSGAEGYIRCDVSSYRQVADLFETVEVDYVYHLAAEFGRWNGEKHYEALWNSNVVGTKNMIRLQEQKRFRMIVFSSSEVYGEYDKVMLERVMDEVPIRQLNDYAMSKWVNEMQVENSREEFGTETVRVRLFNTYGPGEYYSPYRSAICVFIYKALHGQPYTVHLGHSRTSTYVDDTARTLANICERFVPGEVYNIGGTELHDMKEVSDIILGYLGISDSGIVEYRDPEPRTTLHKKVDCSKAVRDLSHEPRITLEEGIPMTIEWAKQAYGL